MKNTNETFGALDLNEMSQDEMNLIDGGSRIGDILHAAWDGVCDYFGQK